jgi:hypothetical protein
LKVLVIVVALSLGRIRKVANGVSSVCGLKGVFWVAVYCSYNTIVAFVNHDENLTDSDLVKNRDIHFGSALLYVL